MKNMKMLPVLNIAPSPTNPRKQFKDLEELAQSIIEHGVLQPVLVRKHPDLPEMYELIAGERRFRAARMAGLDEMPCIIGKLSDGDVLEVQLVENNQRHDVSPFEEADAIASLMINHGRSLDDITEKLGRTERYVQRRLSLQNLLPRFRELFELDMLQLNSCEFLARMPSETQEVVAATMTDEELKDHGKWRLEDVRRTVTSLSRSVSQMPWLLSGTYSGITPCDQCSARTKSQSDLFGSSDENDQCLNRACYDRKLAAWAEVSKAEILHETGWNPPEGCVSPYTSLPVQDGEGYERITEVLGTTATVFVHRPHGRIDKYYRAATAAAELADRGFEKAALSLKGIIGPQSDPIADKAERARARAAEREAEAKLHAKVESVVEWCVAQPWQDIAEWLARGAVQSSNVDVLTSIAKRRDIPMVEAEYSRGRATMEDYVTLDKVTNDETELKRVLVEILIRPTWSNDGAFEDVLACIEASELAAKKEAA